MTEFKENDWLYGLGELSKFLRCSLVTACRYKTQGRVPFVQIGRKIMFNKIEVINALRDETRKNGNRRA